jgi:hypothetical protein
MQLHISVLSSRSAKLPHPAIPHAQKTAASVKIILNHPGCDTYTVRRHQYEIAVFIHEKG